MTGIGLGFGRRKELPKNVTRIGTFLSEKIQQKYQDGLVVSARLMQKTVMVAVCEATPHPKYRKWILSTNKIMVHDENQEADIGDRVRIVHSRTFSKSKHHKLHQILYKDPASRETLRFPKEFNPVSRELYDHRVAVSTAKKGEQINRRVMQPRHRHPSWVSPQDELVQVSPATEEAEETVYKGRLDRKKANTSSVEMRKKLRERGERVKEKNSIENVD